MAFLKTILTINKFTQQSSILHSFAIRVKTSNFQKKRSGMLMGKCDLNRWRDGYYKVVNNLKKMFSGLMCAGLLCLVY